MKRRTGPASPGLAGVAQIIAGPEQENDAEGEKSEYLAQALQNADLDPAETDLLDREVINQRLPAGEADRHRGGERV